MSLERIVRVVGFPFRHPRETIATLGAVGLLGAAAYNIKPSQHIENPSMIASPFQYIEQNYDLQRDKHVGMAMLAGAIVVTGIYVHNRPTPRRSE